MLSAEPVVFVVDDDHAMRDAVSELLNSVGLKVCAYACADDFLLDYNPNQPGCLLLDIRMPGMDGLELQESLRTRQHSLPIVFLTGYGDVPMAVRAMQEGAIDFIEKPFREQTLLKSVRKALQEEADHRTREARTADISARLASLTQRERQVLDLVVEGKHNKEIASLLELSHKTIEFHRSKIMSKMAAESIADLVRAALVGETYPA